MTTSTSKPKLFSTLGQICKLIPVHLVPKLARETGVEQKARTFTPWSHVVSLLYAQLSHALSLNDVCDGLSFVTGKLQAIRGAKAPSRNGFSHANRSRDPELARRLFWATLEHLQTLSPGFGRQQQRRYGFRFKRLIHLVDSTTITLVANCIDWARHRRRKAAAKCHVRLDWGSLLPRFVVVASAGEGDDGARTPELCAGVMAFLTNQLDWAGSSVADLYRCRWQVEVFFKQIKQTLQLADFLGHNENAVRWQVWTALLLYVLLRFLAWVHRWAGSFSRLFTLLRATLWMPKNLAALLERYGTADSKKRRMCAHPESAFLPGMLHVMTP
jgi:hypothetical protein